MPPRTHLSPKDRAFITAQKIFFVATAPLSPDSYVNLSPKGLTNTLAIIDDQTLAYLDLTGSGIETIAHLRENKRIVLMFCSFQGPPNILRIHGRGDVLLPPPLPGEVPESSRGVGVPESTAHDFSSLIHHFPTLPGIRSIIRIHITRIADSCGSGVPLYSYIADRDALIDWANKKGPTDIADYQRNKNSHSLNNLPGLERSEDPAKL